MFGLLAAGCLAASPLPVTDLSGQPRDLRAAAGKVATAVVFLSFDCPVSTSYTTALNDLAREFSGKGVSVVGVASTDDSLDAIRGKAAEFGFNFPLYHDPRCQTADALGATTVPQAVVLVGGKVVYRGRIDDGYAARLKRRPVTSHDLKATLDAVVAGKPVPAAETPVVGCAISRPDQSVAASGPTFHREVSRILQANCQGCHRPGQVGPFSLTTYKQAKNWASDIVEFTQSKRMPPWKPQAGPPHGFSNERRMSEADIATLAKWADAGCPEGNPADAPPPVSYPDEWQNGPPDLILTVPEEFRVGPAGADLYRCFVIPSGLTEDKFIVGYEVRPGNPKVVHHTLNFWDLTGKARQKEADEKAKPTTRGGDGGPGYSVAMGLGFLPTPDPKRPGQPTTGGFGGWAPGQLATRLPAGTGMYLPAGADVVIQTHYHRTGKPETDRTRIGLYFAKGPVEKVWQTLAVGGMSPLTTIPAGKKDFVGKGSAWLTQDAVIHSLIPHMHLIGRSIKMTVTPPGGETVTLIDIPDWDYNWQETYWLRQPITAPKGSRLDIQAVYDNSTGNPHNPSRPPRRVFFGEETTNEMLFGFVGATPAGPNRIRLTRVNPALLGGSQ